jgi:hypothetical protein
MNIKIITMGILIALAFQACGTDSNQNESDYKTISVLSNKAVTNNQIFGIGQTTCLETKKENETTYSVNCDTINGFDYEWGYTYELKVKETILDPAPQDISNIRTDLISIESKIEIDMNSTFNYGIKLYNNTIEFKNSKYYFYNKEFICAEDIECSNIIDLVSEDKKYLLTFEYLGDSKIKLKYFEEDEIITLY